MKSRKLPRFKTDKDFARFVETHDMAPYLADMKSIDRALTLAPRLAEHIRERTRKRLIALRLPKWQIEGARQVAKIRDVPYQALMRDWIGEGLSREMRRPSRSK
jgi:predicted DNA binding CopG/RHH family protein